MPSPPPRSATSRPTRGRLTNCPAAARIASSRRSRSASAAASSAAAGSSAFGGTGSSSRDLRIGEPRRHDEIVGGKFEADLPRLLDEGEILLGERQHGDAVQIDFLAARKFEQEIERPFEAVDIDAERVFGWRPFARLSIERQYLRHNSNPLRGRDGPRTVPRID